MPPAKRSLILCADNFALDEAVSEGILRLVDARRVSAVSCFADAPSWAEAGMKLRDLSGREIALGLHFNLTERFGFGERPLSHWIAASLLRTVDARAIRRRLQRQLERFRDIAGRLPDFIDGHQHVHAFPVIRDAVAAVAAAAGPRPIPLRDVHRFFGPTDAPFKRFVISLLASAARSGPYLNDAMSGDYSLSADADYPGLFAGWLAAAPQRGLIMCHPAAAVAPAQFAPGPCAAVRPRTAHADAGVRELAFLESEAFRDLLAEHAIELAAVRE